MTVTSSQLRSHALGAPETAAAPRRRLRWRTLGLLALAVAAIVVLVALIGRAAGGGGTVSLAGQDLLTYTVQPIDLRVTVLDSGTLESATSVKVFNEVQGEVAIIGLLPEGTRVSTGDVVVELDSSTLESRQREQQIVVEKARASASQAQQRIKVAQSQAESDVGSATLALEFARLDLKQYLEGDYPQEVRVVRADITLAEEELKRAEETLKVSQQLFDEGYLSEGEFEADRLAVTKNSLRLELARAKLGLLEGYTFVRRSRELESKVQEAERALTRIGELAQVSLDQEQTNLRSLSATLQLEEAKLTYIEQQKSKCQMRAPQSGVVVYPIPSDNDMVELFIKQGTRVKERQHVFSIPDTDVMQVSASIHEAMVNKVRPGQPVRIWVDVYPDRELTGTVTWVSSLPDPEDWRRTTVKFYETRIALDGQPEDLRPGMSTKVEILVDAVDDTLAVPVTAVTGAGPGASGVGVCYVKSGGGAELRRLELGKASHEFIEVLSGLSAGERVILSPDVIGVPESVLQEIAKPRELASGETDLPPAPVQPVEDPQIEYTAILSGASGALAEVEYETKIKNGTPMRELDVEIKNGPPGAVWKVAVGGFVAGEVTLDAAGYVKHEWSTKVGNFPEGFPLDAAGGTSVTVGDELSGAFK